MRNEMSLKCKAGVVALLACVALIGCGGDDSEEPAGGSGGSGGSSGTEAGSAGTGGDDAGAGSGGTGGTGGTGGSGGAGGGFMATCTEDMQTTAITCGGTMCPIPMGILGMDTCQRSCCVTNSAGDEVCGTKSTLEQMPTECGAPPPPDQNCPDYTDMLGTMREGCCNDMNLCGAVSTLTNACVTESPLIPDLPAAPQACGEGGGDDAGAP